MNPNYTKNKLQSKSMASNEAAATPEICDGIDHLACPHYLCSGVGQFHTNEADTKKAGKRLKAYIGITLAEIRHLVDNPQMVEKSKARWVIPSTLMSRTFAQQEKMGQYWLLWADIDNNPPTLSKLASLIGNFNYEAYTSRSATDLNPKCRLLIPLAGALNGAQWITCQEILNDGLHRAGVTPDRKSQGFAQLCYLPNRGEFYDRLSRRDGLLLEPLTAWQAEIAAKEQDLAKRRADLYAAKKQAASLRAALLPDDLSDAIGAFNRAYSIVELLVKANYAQRGNTFRHPNSESGSYSASVQRDVKGVWRVHSLSSADPLYTGGHGVGAHDAFSVFKVLWANDDMSTALKLAGDDWLAVDGVAWNVLRRERNLQLVIQHTDVAGVQAGDVRSDPINTVVLHHPTQDNIALIFAKHYAPILRFAHIRGRWLQWDGTRWQVDEMGRAFNFTRNIIRQSNRQGKANIASANFCSGVEKFAKVDPALAVRGDEFDTDNYLLNTPAGTYDLRLGVMRAHSQDDYLSKITAVAPTSEGGERFTQFMLEITGGDTELIAFMKVALGACLSGAVEAHWMMFWTGGGRNGKNTLGDLVMYILGDYAKKIPVATLMDKTHEAHPTELASLLGVRLATSSEVNDGAHWNESRINELTGDAIISARFMRQDFFEFTRTHKHLIYGNHRPQLRSVTDALKARLIIVPFKQNFVGREDFTLPEKLKAESGFVLNWLIEGHADWLRLNRRLPPCMAVKQETDDYFSAQSTFELWLEECCDVVENDDRSGRDLPRAIDLYSNYSNWKKARGEMPVSNTRWGETIKKKFQKETSNGVRYRGIKQKGTEIATTLMSLGYPPRS